MTDKAKGLLWNLILYIAAFAAGLVPFLMMDNIFAAAGAFTIAATLLIFVVTCFYPDTSLYDPYWSVEPPVLLLFLMIRFRLWNPNSILMLFFVTVWATRLTGNWIYTYKGLGHEDWRYAQYREKLSKPAFFLINLFGLQLVPTFVVYMGMIGAIFVLQATEFSWLTVPGYVVMLAAVLLEHVSDTSIHGFLIEHAGEHRSCDVSVWRYSRHPNYLGEMSFWTGIYLVYVALYPRIWYMGLGFLLIIALFLFVSIPMMERHNMERREDYEEYRKKTSRLLLWPPKE